MQKIKKINNFNLTDKKVLVRLDLNIPFENKKVLDDTRIKASIPTLNEIIKRKGMPIVISHFGRPNGKIDKNFSLIKVKKSLSKHAQKKVIFCNDCIGPKVKETIEKYKFGQIILLENLRFHHGEKKNDVKFAKKLAKNCDVYINDAFSASHRKHASIDKIAKLLPSGIGKNMEKEIFNLNKLLKKPKKPITAVIGGAKMGNKINLINNLIKKCNYLIIGGGVANTFLKSNKINIGNSIYEETQLKNVAKIEKNAKKNNCKIIYPIDVTISNKNNINILDLKNNHQIFDLGKNTMQLIFNIVDISKTIIWSGPLGFFEKKPFDKGTNKLASYINSKKKIISVAGGGDTISALKKNKKFNNFSYLSTGGGAFLSWLEDYSLVGIDVLNN